MVGKGAEGGGAKAVVATKWLHWLHVAAHAGCVRDAVPTIERGRVAHRCSERFEEVHLAGQGAGTFVWPYADAKLSCI